ncbi:MAG: hypothetical protein PHG19_10345 [Anaerotignum sp.]|nr:hypothetical protein [Anaerotignum sp.]
MPENNNHSFNKWANSELFPGEFGRKAIVGGTEVSETPLYQMAEKVGSVFQNPRTQFFNVDTDSEIAFGMKIREWIAHI